MRFALEAQKMSPSAVAYRAELWHSIVHARGFETSFAHWWSIRPKPLQDAPAQITHIPPSALDARLIFEDFQLHFRDFEQWHLRQRTSSLKAKYESSLNALFHDLKDDPKPPVNILWHKNYYTVLAFDAQTGQIHLDKDIVQTFDFVWYLHSHMVSITDIQGDIGTFCGKHHPQPGDEIEQQ